MVDSSRIRINRFLSQAGVASRRAADDLVREGRVSVNGRTLLEVGFQIDPDSSIVEVDGKRVTPPVNHVYILLNKPRGYITSLDDPEKRPIVTDLLPPKMPRIWPVGRLDWDSEGFLLLTNDGIITHKLTHPSFHMEKRYALKVRGTIPEDYSGIQKLKEGIDLDDGPTGPIQLAVRSHTDKHTWIEVVLREGRNRIIRRMCEAVGLDLIRLRRLSMGPISIGGVAPGTYRSLLPDEILALYKEIGCAPPSAAQPTKRQQQRIRNRKQVKKTFDVRKKGRS